MKLYEDDVEECVVEEGRKKITRKEEEKNLDFLFRCHSISISFYLFIK